MYSAFLYLLAGRLGFKQSNSSGSNHSKKLRIGAIYENRIRHLKEEAAAFKASGNTFGQMQVQHKLNSVKAEYNQFSKRIGLPVKDNRLAVEGLRGAKVGSYLTFMGDNAKIRKNNGLPKTEKLRNEKLVGVANVSFPSVKSVVPRGTSLVNVTAIAGKGTSTPLRDLKRLSSTYPSAGNPEEWQKKTGTATTNNFSYEIHWYANGEFVPLEDIKTVRVKKP